MEDEEKDCVVVGAFGQQMYTVKRNYEVNTPARPLFSKEVQLVQSILGRKTSNNSEAVLIED
eukprot:12982181-Ditylum_brightwellii.AAC.1